MQDSVESYVCAGQHSVESYVVYHVEHSFESYCMHGKVLKATRYYIFNTVLKNSACTSKERNSVESYCVHHNNDVTQFMPGVACLLYTSPSPRD